MIPTHNSRIAALIATYIAVCEDWTPYLAPGEWGYVSVLANRKPNAHAIMNYIKASFEHPRLRSFVKRELTETVDLDYAMRVEVTTASIPAVRSRAVVAALCDEIAFWPVNEEGADQDEEVLNALRPAMVQFPKSLLLALSSRYARKGALWNAYRDWYGKADGPLVWSADTVTMHPSVDRAYLAEEYNKDPAAAAAEYGKEFRSDVAAYVPREVVEAAIVRGVFEREPRQGITYRAFCDPSGGTSDSFTLAIGHRDGTRGVLDCLREIRPPFSPSSATAELAETLRSYGITEVEGDHYAGEWPRAEFRTNGITYVLSERVKSDIYQAWLPLLNSGKLDLLDNLKLVNQTTSLERRTSRAGRDTIDHPPGGHDDVANAAAGVLVRVVETEHAPLWTVEDLAA